MLPYVRYVRFGCFASALDEVVSDCTAADGAVLLEALLDHAAAVGRDLVTKWPTDWEDIPDSLLRCVLRSGNVEFMRVVLRRGLYDLNLTMLQQLAPARKEGWLVSDGMRELLARYIE